MIENIDSDQSNNRENEEIAEHLGTLIIAFYRYVLVLGHYLKITVKRLNIE